MCDEHTVEENEDFFKRAGDLSRRGFGAAAGIAALAITLPAPADAEEVAEHEIDIKTPDGEADAYFVHPAKGKFPGVIVWPDIMGLRPAFRQMGKRLAQSGYSVLVVNPYYRQIRGEVFHQGESFTNPDIRGRLMPLMGALTAQGEMSDAKEFVKFLDGQKSVDAKKKIGTTGYCMGGPIVMRTAAAVPNRIGAACTFHGGGLATAGEDSPHLLIPQMKAAFLVCVADNDDQRDPKAKDTLKEAFAKAKLPAEIEVYKGAQHGWCPPDSQVYNKEAAEKAWARQLDLFSKKLKA